MSSYSSSFDNPPPDAPANAAAGPLPDANLDAIEAALPTLETLGDLAACLRIAQAAEARLEAFFAKNSRIVDCLAPFGDAVQALWRIIAIRKSMVRLYKEIKSGVRYGVQPSGSPDPDPDSPSPSAPTLGVQPSACLPPDPPSTPSTQSTPPAESASIRENPCTASSFAPSTSSPAPAAFNNHAPQTVRAPHLPAISDIPTNAEIPTIPAANRRILRTIETFIKEIEIKYWRRLLRADRYGLPEPCDLPNVMREPSSP